MNKKKEEEMVHKDDQVQELPDRTLVILVHKYCLAIQCFVLLALLINHGLHYPDYSLAWFNMFSVDSVSQHNTFVWWPVIDKKADVGCLYLPIMYTASVVIYHFLSINNGVNIARSIGIVVMFAFMHVHIAMFVGINDITNCFIIFMIGIHYTPRLSGTFFNWAVVWIWLFVYMIHATHVNLVVPGFIIAMAMLQYCSEAIMYIVDTYLDEEHKKKEYIMISISFICTSMTTWLTFGGSNSLHRS